MSVLHVGFVVSVLFLFYVTVVVVAKPNAGMPTHGVALTRSHCTIYDMLLLPRLDALTNPVRVACAGTRQSNHVPVD